MCPTKGDQNCPNFKTESPACWRPLSPGWIGLLFPPSQLLWFVATQTVVWAPAPPVFLSLDVFWSLELPQALEGKSPCPPDRFSSFGSILMSEIILTSISSEWISAPWRHYPVILSPNSAPFPLGLTTAHAKYTCSHCSLCFSPVPWLWASGVCFSILAISRKHGAGAEASGQSLRVGAWTLIHLGQPWASRGFSEQPPCPNQAVVIPISPETSLHPLQTILPHPPP